MMAGWLSDIGTCFLLFRLFVHLFADISFCAVRNYLLFSLEILRQSYLDTVNQANIVSSHNLFGL